MSIRETDGNPSPVIGAALGALVAGFNSGFVGIGVGGIVGALGGMALGRMIR